MNELKELLKPPFRYEKDVECVYDSNDMLICDLKDTQCTVGEFPLVINFITEALNEKYERDFAEPKKWIYSVRAGCAEFECPDCHKKYDDDWNFCPNCGIKLQAE